MTVSAVPRGTVRARRWAAELIWFQAFGFGLPAIPVSVVLLRERRLPWLWDLFPVYGGPWSGSMSPERVSVLLWLFLLVSLVLASSGWLLWRGQRAGAYLALALLPVEAVFWWGFALPFPPLAGLARVYLVALAWPGLARPRRGSPPVSESR